MHGPLLAVVHSRIAQMTPEEKARPRPRIPCFRLRERGFCLRPGRAACLTPFKNLAVCATRSAGVCICLAPFERSAGLQTCRIADFQSAEPSPVPRLGRRRIVCGLETRVTAGLKTCYSAVATLNTYRRLRLRHAKALQSPRLHPAPYSSAMAVTPNRCALEGIGVPSCICPASASVA